MPFNDAINQALDSSPSHKDQFLGDDLASALDLENTGIEYLENHSAGAVALSHPKGNGNLFFFRLTPHVPISFACSVVINSLDGKIEVNSLNTIRLGLTTNSQNDPVLKICNLITRHGKNPPDLNQFDEMYPLGNDSKETYPDVTSISKRNRYILYSKNPLNLLHTVHKKLSGDDENKPAIIKNHMPDNAIDYLLMPVGGSGDIPIIGFTISTLNLRPQTPVFTGTTLLVLDSISIPFQNESDESPWYTASKGSVIGIFDPSFDAANLYNSIDFVLFGLREVNDFIDNYIPELWEEEDEDDDYYGYGDDPLGV